ncbi:MAG: hypothetical protein WCF12_00465 [Propionicimonas sp.]
MDDKGWQDSARRGAAAIRRALNAETDPERVVAELSEAGRAVEDAVREAMAAAVLSGSSMRRVAEVAGLAPNSVPPRLARSRSLESFADDGTITAHGIAVARHQAAADSGRPPMRFKPRRKDGDDQS